MSNEPILHSHIDDGLPQNHPLADDNVHCVICGDMVHAGNNECMQTWVETGKGPHCLKCFVDAQRAEKDGSIIRGQYAVKDYQICAPYFP